MRAINVWAWQEQLSAPGRMQRTQICSDASGAAQRMAPGGQIVGEAGWHVAIPFRDLSDLAARLSSTPLPPHIRGDDLLQRGEVHTLGIDCHGADGIFYPEGVPGVRVGWRDLDRYGEALRDIGLMTASRSREVSIPSAGGRRLPRIERVGPSTIMLICCNTGAGRNGTRLLQQLSYRFPHRQVVGFSTTVVIPRLQSVEDPATGEACVAPFSLDSGEHGMRLSETDAWMEEFRRVHGQVPQGLPWADATAENAKIAVDGRITQMPQNERRTASLVPSLNGPPRGNTARPTRSGTTRRRVV
ncbi:hypothetical protein ABI59_11890 [Acidobacteria bacterium Mor1]|nr:hypothetical protein ABI59_11890 [Acidobacteria bacterium Mor1]